MKKIYIQLLYFLFASLLLAEGCSSAKTKAITLSPSGSENQTSSSAVDFEPDNGIEAGAPTASQNSETTAPPTSPTTVHKAFRVEGVFSPFAFVYDVDTKTMLYAKGDPCEKIYPASTSKLMTVLIALQYLKPADIVTAGSEVSLPGYDSSLAGIPEACRLSVEMLVEAMLLPSGNDAAYVLAAAAGRKIACDPALDGPSAVTRFIDKLNEYAEALGLTHTHFTGPDGFHDDDHYTCLNDMAVIASLAVQNDVIMKYADMEADTVVFSDGGERTWYNTNALVRQESEYYLPCATGLKTGYTAEAGDCLVVSATNNGRTVVAGVFGAGTSKERFSDAKTLILSALC